MPSADARKTGVKWNLSRGEKIEATNKRASALTRSFPKTVLGVPKRAEHSCDSEVDARGDKAMGFRHDITSHHFVLLKNGGAIEIEADDPNDSASKEAIRDHLNQIARMFSQGDFQLPMLIHATTPTGIDTMKRLKNEIIYAARLFNQSTLPPAGETGVLMCIPPFGLRLPRVASLAQFLVMSGQFHLSIRFLISFSSTPSTSPMPLRGTSLIREQT